MVARKPPSLMHRGDDIKVTVLESVNEARENLRKGICGLLMWICGYVFGLYKNSMCGRKMRLAKVIYPDEDCPNAN